MSLPLVVATDARRDTLVLAASGLVQSATGAAVALLLAFVVAPGAQTDAVLAAYALYLVLVLVAATARTALVPLFGPVGEGFGARAGELVARATLGGAVLAVSLAVLAPALGPAVAQREAGDATAALLVLAPGVALQVRGAALAALLGAAGRQRPPAVAYAAGGLVAVAIVVPLLLGLGALGLPVAALAGSLVLVALLERWRRRVGVRATPRLGWLGERRQWELGGALVAAAGIGLASQAGLAIALAHVDGPPGDVTAYTYAFFFVLTVLAVTSSAASLATVPELVARVAAEGAAGAARYVRTTTTAVLWVVLPLLVAAVAFGRPVLALVLGGTFDARQVALLHEVIGALAVLGVLYAVLYVAGPVVMALGRYRWLLPIAGACLAVLLAVLALAGGGAVAVAWVHAGFGALLTVAVLVLALGRRVPVAGLMRDAVPAVLVCLPMVAGGLLLGPGASAWAALFAAGAGLALVAGTWVSLGPARRRRPRA